MSWQFLGIIAEHYASSSAHGFEDIYKHTHTHTRKHTHTYIYIYTHTCTQKQKQTHTKSHADKHKQMFENINSSCQCYKILEIRFSQNNFVRSSYD